MLSQRVRAIGLSPTLRISGLAQEMRAAGIDVLDFSAGQPDFPTPDAVKAAGQRAIEENRTRYTPNAGAPELRRAIARKMSDARGVAWESDEVLVSPGAKASLYFAFQALLDAGDEVLLPVPYWVSYPEQIGLAGGRAVSVPTDEAHAFRVEVPALEAATTSRTRVIVLNDPSNPTGASYDREALERIAAFVRERDLWVIADEIYSRILFDGRRFVSIASVEPSMRHRTIVIDGASKTFAMTGWRVGWAAGPKEVIAAMARIQSHSTSNATSISQWATLEALASADEEVQRRAEAFQERRDVMLQLLTAIDGVACCVPHGSFYAFPNVSGLLRRIDGADGIRSSNDFATWLLERARVAVVPGEAFGAPGYLRVSFAVSVERIREGVARIATALERICGA